MSSADIVNEWYRQNLSSGPLAQHTPGYNQVVEALPKLIASLDAAAAAATPGATTDPATLIAEAEADLASAAAAQKKTAAAPAASAPAAKSA